MCSQIFPFVRAKTQVCLINKKHRQRDEKKIQKKQKQKFFEIFCKQVSSISLIHKRSLVQREHSLSLSLSLFASSREKTKEFYKTDF